MSHFTETWPEAPRRTTALLAPVRLAMQLIALGSGTGSAAGWARRAPLAVGPTAVTFRATAFGSSGTVQAPPTGKRRVVLAPRAGPLPGSRVSTSRQGATV